MKENGYYLYKVQMSTINANNTCRSIHSRNVRSSDIMGCLRIVQSDAKELGLRGSVTVRLQRIHFGKPYGTTYNGTILVI